MSPAPASEPLLLPHEEKTLRHTEAWRWIATLGDDPAASASPVDHPAHRRWMQVRGNCHSPAYREAMLTFRGEAVHSLGDAIHLRRPGTVMLFDRGESRDLKGAPHKRGFHCLWLHFNSPECLTFNTNSCDGRGRYFQEIPPRLRSGAEVRAVMETWDRCRNDSRPGLFWNVLKTRITLLFLEILATPLPPPRENQHAQVIASIEAYIRAHLEAPLNLHTLAQIAGYSPFFFHRLFVRHTGMTPVAYTNAARLEKACERLREGYTVAAVAESVGFASPSYFNRFFRKAMGHSPRAWSELEAALPAPAIARE